MARLKQCSRVGIDLTWRCNWSCQNCFYRFDERLHSLYDKPFSDVITEIESAASRGCDHVVAIGWGEPTLYKHIKDFITTATSFGMTSSIITNGTSPVSLYEELYNIGLNHLHVSVHGLGDTLDAVSSTVGASRRQEELKKFLRESKLPWRSNTTLQHENYKHLPDIVSDIAYNGAFHIVLLGFLPHYEWARYGNNVNVLVHPNDLNEYITSASDVILDAGRLLTIRYHPFCYLTPRLWKYVVNARYVLYDPWEWDYLHHGESDDVFRANAERLGVSVANKLPCLLCSMYMHCGGWNKTYAELCKATLIPISQDSVPDEYKESASLFGGLHVMNPANTTSIKGD